MNRFANRWVIVFSWNVTGKIRDRLFTSFKGYLHYKTIISENVSSEAQVKNFFYFVEKLYSTLKIFKLLYF